MKNFKLYKNINSIRVKALILTALQLGTIGITTSCEKETKFIDTTPSMNVSFDEVKLDSPEPTPQPNIQLPTIFHHYDLNSFEFKKNDFSVLNTDFYPSEETYNKIMKDVQSYPLGSSFIAVNLNDGATFGYNVDDMYWSASTIKCAYALYVCKLIDEGKASFDDILTVSSTHNDDGSGNIQYMKRGTELTLKEVLHYTLDVSDNQGYQMLNQKFGLKDFNLMLQELGCDGMLTPGYGNYRNVTCRSFALLWQEIINYSKTETEAAKFLYDTLLNAKYNYIKEGITDKPSLHKSGWFEDGVCNDTGVVLNDENPYILVILTKGNGINQLKKIAKDVDVLMNEYGIYLKENFDKIYTYKNLIYKKK